MWGRKSASHFALQTESIVTCTSCPQHHDEWHYHHCHFAAVRPLSKGWFLSHLLHHLTVHVANYVKLLEYSHKFCCTGSLWAAGQEVVPEDTTAVSHTQLPVRRWESCNVTSCPVATHLQSIVNFGSDRMLCVVLHVMDARPLTALAFVSFWIPLKWRRSKWEPLLETASLSLVYVHSEVGEGGGRGRRWKVNSG